MMAEMLGTGIMIFLGSCVAAGSVNWFLGVWGFGSLFFNLEV
jgi:glycerol uptake facilitator-like aquaporin